MLSLNLVVLDTWSHVFYVYVINMTHKVVRIVILNRIKTTIVESQTIGS
jgi:hypothetical protein